MYIKKFEDAIIQNVPEGVVVQDVDCTEDPTGVRVTVSYRYDGLQDEGNDIADEILKKLDKIEHRSKAIFAHCRTARDLDNTQAALIGRYSEITVLLAQLGRVPSHRRREVGDRINEVVKSIKEEYVNRTIEIKILKITPEETKQSDGNKVIAQDTKGVWGVYTYPPSEAARDVAQAKKIKERKEAAQQARKERDKLYQEAHASENTCEKFKTPSVNHDAEWVKELKERKEASRQVRADRDKIYQEALEEFAKKTGRVFTKQELKRGSDMYTSPNTVTEVEVMATKKISEKLPRLEKPVNLRAWLRDATKIQNLINVIPYKPTLLERIKDKFFDKTRSTTMERHHKWLLHRLRPEEVGKLVEQCRDTVATTTEDVRPGIRAGAEAMQRLISEGKLKLDDVDQLIEHGCDAEVVAYWKSTYCAKPKKSLILKIKELFGNKSTLKDFGATWVNMFQGSSKQAEAIQQLVIEGQLLPSDVDKLLEHGVSGESVKYWKSVYNFGPFKGKKMPTVAELEAAIREPLPECDDDDMMDNEHDEIFGRRLY